MNRFNYSTCLLQAAQKETGKDCFCVEIIRLPLFPVGAQVEDGRVVSRHVLVLLAKPGVRTRELVFVLHKVFYWLLGDSPKGHQEQRQVLYPSVDEELGKSTFVLVEAGESEGAAGEAAEADVAASRAGQRCRCVSQADKAEKLF